MPPIHVNELSAGCILMLNSWRDTTEVRCHRSGFSWKGNNHKGEENSGEGGKCATDCKLNDKGYGHPIIVLAVSTPAPTTENTEPRVWFVQMTSSEHCPPPNTCFSPLGKWSHIVVHSRYWCREDEDLRKPTLICLPHVYTLPLHAFSPFDPKDGQEICAHTRRIDEGSFKRLVKRLNYKELPVQDYKSDSELQMATEARKREERGKSPSPPLLNLREFPPLGEKISASKTSQFPNQHARIELNSMSVAEGETGAERATTQPKEKTHCNTRIEYWSTIASR